MPRFYLETDMSVDQLYANGRIAVMSTRLMGADKLARLAECNTLAEAVKLLQDSAYGGGAALSTPNDYEQLLVAELDEALRTLKELCSDKYALKYFLAKYDYLNAKALMKCKYMRRDGLAYCYKEGSFAPEQMQADFVADDYSSYGKSMAEACDKIDAEYANGNRSPSVIDVTLDKAMFADMAAYANKCRLRYKFVKQMFVYLADTANLMSAYRVKKAGLDKSVYVEMLVDGGKLSRDSLLNLFDDERKSADMCGEYKRFYSLTSLDNASLAPAEKEQRTHLRRILRDNADFLTIQPVLEYFFNKVNEIERIRRVLAAIKGGKDKDKIKDMLSNV